MLTETQVVLREAQRVSSAAYQALSGLPQPGIEMYTRKVEMTPGERRRQIAVAAYFRAEHRGFVPGHEKEDWLAAEKDIDGVSD